VDTQLKLVSEHACFGGKVAFYRHFSNACNGEMRFSIYLPPQAQNNPVPVLYFLSGLTCTEENFMVKSGAQKFAAQYGLMLVNPDTSPRNTGIPGEDTDWDFGTGAGFYVDATEAGWSQHYRMYSYVVHELPSLIEANFPVIKDCRGISGHSMGGHGALICGLKNPQRYRSVSAFSPIAAPSQCAWGQKAFSNYLGSNRETWANYDATELVQHNQTVPILIDQGMADPYLKEQLLLDIFEQACLASAQPLILRRQENYDHGYYFISTFIEDHLRHHAEALYKKA
jgi:S-formylglutathione hydrolase